MQTIARMWTRVRALVCVLGVLGYVDGAFAAYVWTVNGTGITGSSYQAAADAFWVPGTDWASNTSYKKDQAVCTLGGTGATAHCIEYVEPKTGGAQSSPGSFDVTRTGTPDPDVCSPETGQVKTTNYTVGWVKNPNAEPVDSVANMVGDYLGPKIGDSSCVPVGTGYCRRSVQSTAGKGYVSLEVGPSGLYRMSMDFQTSGVGTSCTPGTGDAAANPATAPPACPGQYGLVNGKSVCMPAPAAAGASAPTPLPAPSNPASAPPAGTPYNAGNPAAGDKPSSGPGSGDGGSGRTPLVGSGTNAGGSSSASNGQLAGSGVGGGGSSTPGAGGSGTGSAGTTDKPRDPCGLPGTPACRIDETGTPNGVGSYDAATTALNANKQSAIDQVNSAAGSSGKDTSWGFGFNLPSGCSAVPMDGYGFSVNVCQWQGTIHDLMSMLWIAATLCGVIWMVYDTLAKGG